MKITYDSKAKALYIQLKNKPNHIKTLELSDSVNIDLDKDLDVYGVEILNVEKMPKIKNITGGIKNELRAGYPRPKGQMGSKN